MSQRYLYLDILRGFAILAVLFQHMPMNSLTRPFDFILRMGWIGVDLFLVLSGFLISGLLFKDHEKYGAPRIKRFLIRRSFKIYPPYYLLLLTIYIYHEFKGLSVSFIPYCLAFIQNYFPHIWSESSSLEHTWSLAIEEHFYILLPLFILLKGKNITWIALFICVSCLTLRIITHFQWEKSYTDLLYPTHLRLDSLMAGVVIRYFYFYHKVSYDHFICKHHSKILILMVTLFSLFLIAYHQGQAFTIGLTLLYLSFSLFIVLIERLTIPNNFFTKALQIIGQGSYLIYLIHIPVKEYLMYKVTHLLSGGETILLIVYFGLSLSLGLLLFFGLEKPLLKYRDKLCH